MRLKAGTYELSLGSPGLSGIRWWLSLERYRPTCISAGQQLYSITVIFRLQYMKLPVTFQHIHDRWRFVRVA